MRSSLTMLLLLLLAAPVRAAPENELRALLAKGKPAAGRFGLSVLDAETGKKLFDTDGLTPRLPASTLKIVTTAASLMAFGEKHVLKTAVVAGGRPDGAGRVDGDLIVVGGGDPTTDVTRSGPEAAEGAIDRLARLVARAGVRSVTGNLVLDDGRFDRQLRHPSWPANQLQRPYCAPVTPLTVGRGCLTVEVRPGAKVGDPAKVSLIPDSPAVRLKNGLLTVAERKSHRILLDLPPDGATLKATGKVWIKAEVYSGRVAAPDPARLFGEALRRRLIGRGISVAGKVVRRPGAAAALGEAREIAAVTTPLIDVIRTTNKESQNLYAECLLKNLGHLARKKGSFESGGAATARLAKSLGFPDGHLLQADGSGLSRDNRVTPYFLARFLTILYAREDWKAFVRTFPFGGEAGTSLRRRMKDLGTDVVAKTGTIDGVTGLAGYVRTKSGKVIAFAFLINDPATPTSKGREVQDKVCRIIHEGF